MPPAAATKANADFAHAEIVFGRQNEAIAKRLPATKPAQLEYLQSIKPQYGGTLLDHAIAEVHKAGFRIEIEGVSDRADVVPGDGLGAVAVVLANDGEYARTHEIGLAIADHAARIVRMSARDQEPDRAGTHELVLTRVELQDLPAYGVVALTEERVFPSRFGSSA